MLSKNSVPRRRAGHTPNTGRQRFSSCVLPSSRWFARKLGFSLQNPVNFSSASVTATATFVANRDNIDDTDEDDGCLNGQRPTTLHP